MVSYLFPCFCPPVIPSTKCQIYFFSSPGLIMSFLRGSTQGSLLPSKKNTHTYYPGIYEFGPNIHFQPCISLQHEVFTPASRFSHSLWSSLFEGPSDISILHILAHIDFSPTELLTVFIDCTLRPSYHQFLVSRPDAKGPQHSQTASMPKN